MTSKYRLLRAPIRVVRIREGVADLVEDWMWAGMRIRNLEFNGSQWVFEASNNTPFQARNGSIINDSWRCYSSYSKPSLI